MFQTKDLLAAAKDLHRAIRAAVDPEAFSDFRGCRCDPGRVISGRLVYLLPLGGQ